MNVQTIKNAEMALQFLDQATQPNVQLSRSDYVKINEALLIFARLLSELSEQSNVKSDVDTTDAEGENSE